jgi:hypothetical protein
MIARLEINNQNFDRLKVVVDGHHSNMKVSQRFIAPAIILAVSRNLCDKIIKLDRNIRFVGIVNNKGEVIDGGFQEGVEPLLDESDEQEMYANSLLNMTLLQNFSDRLGKVKYSLTEHQKIALMTFPIDNGILCISVYVKDTNLDKLKNAILRIISK